MCIGPNCTYGSLDGMMVCQSHWDSLPEGIRHALELSRAECHAGEPGCWKRAYEVVKSARDYLENNGPLSKAMIDSGASEWNG